MKKMLLVLGCGFVFGALPGMAASHSVTTTANLDSRDFLLTVVNGTGGGSYVVGSEIVVTAAPAPVGHRFDRWIVDPTGADTGGNFDCLDASTTLTMPALAVTLTAQQVQYIYPVGGVVVQNRNPTFFWPSVEGATWYQLWIQHNGLTYETPWIEGATTWTPASGLKGGTYQWWVRGWGPVIGYDAWSVAADFSIVTMTPAAIGQLGPVGGQPSRDLQFRWTKDINATWYRLWVSHPGGGTWHDQWYEMSGTGEGAVTLNNHPGGTSDWWMQAWGPDGMGPWSGPMTFSTPAP